MGWVIMPNNSRSTASRTGSTEAQELPMRITILNPVPGVALTVRGDDPRAAVIPTGPEVSFDFVVRVKRIPGDDHPRFLGACTQGPPSQRFVYVDVGTLADQADSRWTRAAKIPLSGISWSLINEAWRHGGRLEARIQGRAKDGGPACATVPLLEGGWRCRREH